MKMFAHLRFGLLAAAVMLAQVLPTAAKEEKVKLSDCPAAVQKTIKDQAEGGKILEIEKETKKDGTVVYEAEIKRSDGKKVEIEVAEDGKLLDTEVEDDEDDDDKEDDDD